MLEILLPQLRVWNMWRTSTTTPRGLNVLLQAYLHTGHLPEAGGIAISWFAVHNDVSGITAYADALIGAGRYDEAYSCLRQIPERMLAGIRQDSGDTASFNWAGPGEHGIFGDIARSPAKAGEQTHLTEIYELLAHAYTQSGDFEKARDYYLKLTQLEPHNQLHADNYQQGCIQAGTTTTSRGLITAEEGSVIVG